MSDELLRYYEDELAWLRRDAASFAGQHPKIARRLRMDGERIEDPHVERLIEAVAYLNARIRRKLDDDFPEITQAILGVLYPQYLAPVPSMTIGEFRLLPPQAELALGVEMPRGSAFETEAVLPEGDPVRFRTSYPLRVFPIEIAAASLERKPFKTPPLAAAEKARSVLRIHLQSLGGKLPLREMPIRSLRLFLNLQAPFVHRLYELLGNDIVGAFIGPRQSRDAAAFSKVALRPVGFTDDEAVLPDDPRTLPGYRLLLEYFTFPEKFHFFDVELPAGWAESCQQEAELLIYLGSDNPDLESSISSSTLRLGCTPLVNLYTQTAEPVRLNQHQAEYRIVPDARRPRSHEIFSIDEVLGIPSAGEPRTFHPFYSFKHAATGAGPAPFWHAVRRPAQSPPENPDQGTEVYLTLVDSDMDLETAGAEMVRLKCTCLNRDLPHQIPFGGNQPGLFPSGAGAGAGILSASCLTRPTRTRRPVLGQGTRWRLISHLALNGLSLRNFEEGGDGLRELLHLYDFVGDEHTEDLIASLTGVSGRRTTGRVTEMLGGRRQDFLCRGLEIHLQFRSAQFTERGTYLFAAVLEAFLAVSCTLNSFSQTVVSTDRGEVKRWPKRAGSKVLA